MHEGYNEHLRPFQKGEGSGQEQPQEDLVSEYYDLISGEWEQWQSTAEEEEFDALKTLRHMGFYGFVDTQGRRLYSKQLGSVVNDDGSVNETVLFDIFLKEAERRAKQEDTVINEKEDEPIFTTISVDTMILDPGEGSFSEGEGNTEFTEKKLELRKEMFKELLTELHLSAVVVPMKKKRDLSEEVRAQVNSSVRGSLTSDYERAMYTLYIIPQKEVSVFISDLEGEGTHVVFHSPLLDNDVEASEAEEAIAEFLKLSSTKEKMKSEEYPFLHQMVPYADDMSWKNYVKTLLNNVESVTDMMSTLYENPQDTLEISNENDMSFGEIVALVGGDPSWVVHRLRLIISEHPDLAPVQKINRKNGRTYNHYTREVADKVLEIKNALPEVVQEGEMTMWSMKNYFSKSQPWIERAIRRVLKVKPYLSAKEKRVSTTGARTDFYFPKEMVDEIQRLYDAIPDEANKEEKTVHMIHRELNRSHKWIQRNIQRILKTKPYLKAKKRLNVSEGNVRQYYPLELFEDLKVIADAEKISPAGWEVIGSLSSGTGISHIIKKSPDWIKIRIIQLLNAHPEWKPQKFMNKAGRVSNHYPPELIKELEQILEEENARES